MCAQGASMRHFWHWLQGTLQVGRGVAFGPLCSNCITEDLVRCLQDSMRDSVRAAVLDRSKGAKQLHRLDVGDRTITERSKEARQALLLRAAGQRLAEIVALKPPQHGCSVLLCPLCFVELVPFTSDSCERVLCIVALLRRQRFPMRARVDPLAQHLSRLIATLTGSWDRPILFSRERDLRIFAKRK